jgi:hypothetical protein
LADCRILLATTRQYYQFANPQSVNQPIMKYSLFILFTMYMLLAMAQTKKYQVCIIAFYNLENFYDTIDNPIVNDDEFTPHGIKQYNSKIYLDKVTKLATVISMLGSDISADGAALIGVAEIENDTVLTDLVRHPLIRQRHYSIVHFDSKDVRGVDVGLLYQPKYFVPQIAEKLFVPLPGNSKEAYYTRDILYVKGSLAGEPVHIYVNHWPSRRGGEERSSPARSAAAGVCRKHADSILSKEPLAKMVLMGDLNDDPDSKSITQVLGAKGKTEVVAPGGWFNPWLALYRQGLGTLANRDSWGLFDQILLSYGWLNTVQAGLHYHRQAIFVQDFMKEDRGRFKGYPMRTWDGNNYRGGYSDHFPTFVVLVRNADHL